MTDNDNKNKLTGKLQLKKTINAGQIKQSFSHGRSRSVSVEVKKKRSISGFSKNEKEQKSFDNAGNFHQASPKKFDKTLPNQCNSSNDGDDHFAGSERG